ncbi:MAG: hypothetical protein ACYCWE_03025 [Eubacteriales bacterium]
MSNSKITSKAAEDMHASAENSPGSDRDDLFNYETYGETKKGPARIPMTRDQLMQGIIFSEIIGPPVSKRNRFGRK